MTSEAIVLKNCDREMDSGYLVDRSQPKLLEALALETRTSFNGDVYNTDQSQDGNDIISVQGTKKNRFQQSF